jgi:predicted AlkP superfamily phosphohydrolase/phosphomutase
MGDALFRLYRAIDDEIGAIVDALPSTATVVVSGSVGMLSQYPTEELLEGFCRRLGYQASPQPAAPSGPAPRRSVSSMLRALVPERARNLISRFLPFHVQERLLSEKFAASTDWSRTTVYAPPGYYTGCLRVNLRGREPNGIVAPGEEYDALLSRLEEDLHALRDAETGAAVIARTVRTREVFGHDAHPALPDLTVFWHEHHRPLRRVRHPRAELTQSPHAFNRGSHHTTEGILVAAGAAVRAAGRVPDVDALSLAPTMLTLLDVAPPGEMTGSPLHDWLTSPSAYADTGT